MLEYLIVFSLVIGIRFLRLANRPTDQLDAGDIKFIDKNRKKKDFDKSLEEMQVVLKKRAKVLLVMAGILIPLYLLLLIGMMSSM